MAEIRDWQSFTRENTKQMGSTAQNVAARGAAAAVLHHCHRIISATVKPCNLEQFVRAQSPIYIHTVIGEVWYDVQVKHTTTPTCPAVPSAHNNCSQSPDYQHLLSHLLHFLPYCASYLATGVSNDGTLRPSGHHGPMSSDLFWEQHWTRNVKRTDCNRGQQSREFADVNDFADPYDELLIGPLSTHVVAAAVSQSRSIVDKVTSEVEYHTIISYNDIKKLIYTLRSASQPKKAEGRGGLTETKAEKLSHVGELQVFITCSLETCGSRYTGQTALELILADSETDSGRGRRGCLRV
ncbi:hypothetical protein EXN66_Car003514 [Channa argus]|uniref:Uncharacterized protein n=1 Tax=Channa argus TaxID=215402 RepID=A0A6G1PC73_CHAAH|nr:hypothetical protein EXN66_Car003514 [Channa argus]